MSQGVRVYVCERYMHLFLVLKYDDDPNNVHNAAQPPKTWIDMDLYYASLTLEKPDKPALPAQCLGEPCWNWWVTTFDANNAGLFHNSFPPGHISVNDSLPNGLQPNFSDPDNFNRLQQTNTPAVGAQLRTIPGETWSEEPGSSIHEITEYNTLAGSNGHMVSGDEFVKALMACFHNYVNNYNFRLACVPYLIDRTNCISFVMSLLNATFLDLGVGDQKFCKSFLLKNIKPKIDSIFFGDMGADIIIDPAFFKPNCIPFPTYDSMWSNIYS